MCVQVLACTKKGFQLAKEGEKNHGGRGGRRAEETTTTNGGGGGKGQRRDQRHMANMCLVFGSAGATAHGGGHGALLSAAMRGGAQGPINAHKGYTCSYYLSALLKPLKPPTDPH